jgi:hypothetical protein
MFFKNLERVLGGIVDPNVSKVVVTEKNSNKKTLKINCPSGWEAQA